METQLLIDNQEVPATGGASFARCSSTTGSVVTRAAAATIEDAVEAVDSASRAFSSWSHTGPTERRRLLLKAADILETKTPELIGVMAAEIGASQLWAVFNVASAAAIIREAASLTTQILGETIPTDRPETLSMTVRQPVGVVLSIVPWNGPVALAARAIAYPIACGNTVVLRASETGPKTHMLVVDAFREAGLPDGVLNALTNAPDDASAIVDALIGHKAVRRINFTGSTRVGRIIAEKAAKHLKRCLLELGGKSPLIVLDDADIDEAVNAAVFGCFLYQGQICMTTGRIILDEKIADQFVAKFAARAKELTTGDPATEAGGTCVVGPMIARDSAVRLAVMVNEAIEQGASVVAGGATSDVLMPATIVDHVTPAMRLYEEESFGPVIALIRARDTEDAVRIANDTQYGLSGAVFGRDVHRALQVALLLETGICHVNGATVNGEPQAPFGGVKNSGYGRFDGRAVIDEFTELRWITIGPQKQHYPF